MVTIIVSDSAQDNVGGSGATTVSVQGLDGDYRLLEEIVTMNGLTPIELPAQFLRVFRVRVITSGSNESNVGNIDVMHGSTVLARIASNIGTTFMAIYTTPVGHLSYIKTIYIEVGRDMGGQTIMVDAQLRVRTEGTWHVELPIRLDSASIPRLEYSFDDPGLHLEEKTDIVWRVTKTTANSIITQAGFSILQVS